MILSGRRPFGAIAPSYKFAGYSPRPILPRHPSRHCPYRQRLVLMLLLPLTAYSANAVQAALQELITNPERADNGEGQVTSWWSPMGA